MNDEAVKIFYMITKPVEEDAPNLLEQQRMLQSFKEAFLGKVLSLHKTIVSLGVD